MYMQYSNIKLIRYILDASDFLEVVEELLALMALCLAILHGISAQEVIEFDGLDCACASLVLAKICGCVNVYVTLVIL